MFRTLYARLVAGLVALVICLSALYLWITLHSGQQFYQEVTQRLNQQLAADLTQVTTNLVADAQLSIADGQYDETALDSVFHTYMLINPGIQVYLLDENGRILAFHAPPGTVKQRDIDLAPVRAFLNGEQPLPILGDDPRHAGHKEIFSVAPLGDPGQPQGYLYVVLGGEQLQAIAQALQASRIPQFVTLATLSGTLLALIAGLVLLRYLTRRLRMLSNVMARFEQNDFERLATQTAGAVPAADDIGRLQLAFTRMAGRIIEQIRQLRQTDSLRRELVANVSHDLRTPLASLQGYLETLLIKNGKLSDDERRDFLQRSLRQCQGLGKLVDALFELAKLDSGQVRPKRECFSLAELAQDVSLKHALAAQQNSIHLATEIPDNLPAVDADIGLIERVLDNLFDNAIRHTPEGGRIEVVLSSEGDQVSVRVTDTGQGISTDDMPYIFNRFYQSRDGAGNDRGGAGLGLAISKRILELHASDLGVDSEVGRGTCVYFNLPSVAALGERVAAAP